MTKYVGMALSDRELQELYRILLDRDEQAALAFLEQHLGSRVRRLMEGG